MNKSIDKITNLLLARKAIRSLPANTSITFQELNFMLTGVGGNHHHYNDNNSTNNKSSSSSHELLSAIVAVEHHQHQQ